MAPPNRAAGKICFKCNNSPAATRWSARTVGTTCGELLDIRHADDLKRDSIRSSGHSDTIHQTSGHAIIGDHETGEYCRVEARSNHDWINHEDLYIATDNPLFAPRTQSAMNHQQWRHFLKESPGRPLMDSPQAQRDVCRPLGRQTPRLQGLAASREVGS